MPHIEKALKNLDNYVIDGPSGGRIIQVRNKKLNSLSLD